MGYTAMKRQPTDRLFTYVIYVDNVMGFYLGQKEERDGNRPIIAVPRRNRG